MSKNSFCPLWARHQHFFLFLTTMHQKTDRIPIPFRCFEWKFVLKGLNSEWKSLSKFNPYTGPKTRPKTGPKSGPKSGPKVVSQIRVIAKLKLISRNRFEPIKSDVEHPIKGFFEHLSDERFFHSFHMDLWPFSLWQKMLTVLHSG